MSSPPDAASLVAGSMSTPVSALSTPRNGARSAGAPNLAAARELFGRTGTLPMQYRLLPARTVLDETDSLVDVLRSSSLDHTAASKPATPTAAAAALSMSTGPTSGNGGGMTAARVNAIREKISGAKSRTLPSRRNTKKNHTTATRLKTYMSQQRIDGVYCVVALVAPEVDPTPATPPPPVEPAASSSSSSSSSSGSSSDSSDDSSSSDDSNSDDDSSPHKSLASTVPLSAATSQKRKKRKKKVKPAPKPKPAEPVIFVINRHGGLFGKNPAIGLTSDLVPGLSSTTEGTESSTATRSTPQPKHCVIMDAYTSKRHFQILGDTKGKFYITDLGSLNGTFVRRNFDPLLALGANASKVYGVAAAAALQGRDSAHAPGQGGRGMSPVMMCSSPTHQARTHAASVNSPNPPLPPLSHAESGGRESWGTGSWANSQTPASIISAGCSTNASALIREGSSGSGDNSTSASGSASVSQSGYASVGTQWLNSQGHATSSGYRLTKNSVFLLGKCELMVVKIHDIENPLPDEDDDDSSAPDEVAPPLQSYHVVLSYSYKPMSPDGSTTAPVLRTKQIGILGCRIGRHADAEICLSVPADGTIDEFQSEVLFENGKFYMRDLHWTMDKGLWSRLTSKTAEDATSPPSATPMLACQLYNGDRIKVGMSEFTVSIRSIPPPLSITSQGSAYEIGTALEGNFLVQKEMQDRLVAIGNYGGHPNQAFFAVYDGHQERTVADFAAAAFHHNLMEEIWTVTLAAKKLTLPKSVTNSTMHSPRVCPTTAGIAGLNVHSRSRSGSEARPPLSLTARHQVGLLGAAGGSVADSIESVDCISLDALSGQPPLPPYPPASSSPFSSSPAIGSISPHALSGLSINCDVSSSSAQSPPPNSRLTPASGTHAGHRKNSSSLLASALLHAHIGRNEVDMVACVRAAYARTSAQIKGMGDAASYGGCTAVSVLLWHHPLLQETRLIASNIGDSRALLIREGGRPELLSHLHIGRDPSEQTRVRAAGGRIMQNGRLAGCLEVTRAFGDHGMISFGLVSEPFIVETVLQPTDTHLLVSSDGLFDVLTYDEIAHMLRQAPPECSAQQLAFALVEAAMKRKARDNMSLVLVKLNGGRVSERAGGATAVSADSASSGSLASTTVGSGSSAVTNGPASKELLPATSALVDQLIAKPLARVPSLASIYPSQPLANQSTVGGLAATSASSTLQSPLPSTRASPPPILSPSSSLPVLSSPLSLQVHSASTSPLSHTQRLAPPSDFSLLEAAGRASSVPNASCLVDHQRSMQHRYQVAAAVASLHGGLATPPRTPTRGQPGSASSPSATPPPPHAAIPVNWPSSVVHTTAPSGAATTRSGFVLTPLSPINAHSPSHGIFAFSPLHTPSAHAERDEQTDEHYHATV